MNLLVLKLVLLIKISILPPEAIHYELLQEPILENLQFQLNQLYVWNFFKQK